MQDTENETLKRKSEAGDDTERDQRIRRPAALRIVGNQHSIDVSKESSKDTGGGVWNALFPGEDQSRTDEVG